MTDVVANSFDRSVPSYNKVQPDAMLAEPFKKALPAWLTAPMDTGVQQVKQPSPAAPVPTTQVKQQERTLITQLLSHFKQTAEVRQYLKYYGRVDKDRFAVIQLSGDVLSSEESTERVASSLAFLHRIGLVPIVVHGAGVFTGRQPAAVAQATAAGQPSAIMSAAVQYMSACNARLVQALAKEGVAATPLTSGVFTARAVKGSTASPLSGLVGAIEGVNSDAIAAAVQAGALPIVAAIATHATPAGEEAAPALTFPTHDAAIAIAGHVQPLKVIWLRPEGGLKTSAGGVVRSVDLARDAPHLVSTMLQDVHAPNAEAAAVPAAAEETSAASKAEVVVSELDLAPADAASLVQLASFHGVLSEPGATVSVTDPEHLAEELFTHKGAGTLIARGERILAHSSLSTVDVPRLRACIEAAFGAPLPEGYLEALATSGKLHRVYVSEHYRGAAVVLRVPGVGPETVYLDKFAVDPSAQGDKLGETLWRAMTGRENKLFWRSRSTNKVNPWYYEQSHGCLKAAKGKSPTGDWTVFWRNLEEEEVMAAVDTALGLPATFSKQVYPANSDGPAAPLSQPLLK